MGWTPRTIFWCMTLLATVSLFKTAHAQTNPFSKAQVGDRIRKVEDGVDEFRSISKIAEKTPRTAPTQPRAAPTRPRAAVRQGDAKVQILRTQTRGQTRPTRPTRQKTTSKTPWTI